MDNRFLNKTLGKKTLFIEAPTLTKDKVLEFVKKNKVTRCFCLSPIDYTQSKYPSETNQREFYWDSLCLYLKLVKLGIKVIPHIHLNKDCSYEEAKNKIQRTLTIFWIMKACTDEIYPGWHIKSPVFKKICKELSLKIPKKMFHYYDFWIE